MSKTQQPRKSFAFYWSFKDAIKDMSDADKLSVYESITDFAFLGIEPTTLTPIGVLAWKLIRPQLIASMNRYDAAVDNGVKGKEYGKLGGAPKGNQNARKTTPEDNPRKQPQKQPLNDNYNDNLNHNENKNENSLSLTPSHEVVSECGTAEREKERFFEIFFFMNFQNPSGEVDRFVNHYSANGWCRANSTTPVKDRFALARSWSQADKAAPPRFPPEFLTHWQEVYAEAKKCDAKSARIMITDLETVEITPQMIQLRCSDSLRQFIESNAKFFKPRLMDRFYRNCNLFYAVK